MILWILLVQLEQYISTIWTSIDSLLKQYVLNFSVVIFFRSVIIVPDFYTILTNIVS